MRAFAAFLLLVASAAHAEDTTITKRVLFKTGNNDSLYPVLTVPYDGPAPKRPLRAVDTATIREFPATVHDGKLTFVPEGGLKNTEHKYKFSEFGAGDGYLPVVNIKPAKEGEVLEVYILDQLFTAYHFPKDGKKPFLWPLNSAGGVSLTRDYPMDQNNTPKDHPHHRSCWTSFGDLNGADCWTESEESGFQQSGEVTSGSGDAFGWIKAKNVWQGNDRKPVIDEEREYRFYATPETARMFDVTVTFTAAYGDVNFGDTKEGGLVSVRMRQELCGSNAIITNALGDVGEPTLWGKPSPWCDFSGKLGDHGNRGLTIFDTPANLRYPTSWHVRAYGLMGANPFGWAAFAEKEYNKGLFAAPRGDFNLKNGEKLTMTYRVYVHTGDVKEANVADRFADYTATPQLSWID